MFYDVVGYQVELEGLLTINQINELLNKVSPYCPIIPFVVSESNTTAIGFISASILGKGFSEEQIEEKIAEIIGDLGKETPNHVYNLFDGKVKMFLGYTTDEIIDVDYVSVWDGDEIKSSAKLNLNSGEVFDIKTVEISNEYNTCEKEFINFPNGDRVDVKEKGGMKFIATWQQNV